MRHTTPASNNAVVGQLDLLRGIAIVLMIVNHAGIRLLYSGTQNAEPGATALFIGSLAPVLFFFSTGFGAGLSRRVADRHDLVAATWRSCLLIIADQFLWWKGNEPWGLDFLGFIGLAGFLVTLLRMSRNPLPLALILLSAILLLRFAIGPSVRGTTGWSTVYEWAIGIDTPSNISYPLSPWMAFPVIGFIMARYNRGLSPTGLPARWHLMVLSGAVFFSIALLMYSKGSVFFRWGSMSLAYFVLSIGAIATAVIGAWSLMAVSPFAAQLLAIRGPASLAVVPVHYALIELAWSAGFKEQSAAFGAVVIIALCAASILLARRITSWISRTAAPGETLFPLILGLGSLACGVITWDFAVSALSFCAFVLGQLAIAGLFVIRDGRRNIVRQSSGG